MARNHAAVGATAKLAGLTLVDCDGRSAWSFLIRDADCTLQSANDPDSDADATLPIVSLIVQGLKKAEAEINGSCVALHAYDESKRRWQVSELGNNGTGQRVQARGGALALRVSDPPTRPMTMLTPDLAKQAVALRYFEVTDGLYSVDSGDGVVSVPASSLRDASGVEPTPPVEVVDQPSAPGQSMVRACWRFVPGQLIFLETPVLQRPRPVRSGLDGLVDDLDHFFALPDAERARILALYATDVIQLKSASSAHSPTASFVDHAAERVQTDAAALLRLLEQRGARVAEGRKFEARRFLSIWDANAFNNETGLAMYLLLSRLNHSCEPNAQRMPCGDAFYLVALRPIEVGDEITHSYLRQNMLLEPRAMRAKRLASWFPTCWCARCAADEDDVRRFPCAAAGCAGEFVVLHAGGFRACTACGAPPANGPALLRLEDSLQNKYLGFERDQSSITEKGVDSLMALAQRTLGARHWMRAGIADLARDVLVQVAMRCTNRPLAERARALTRAAALAIEWTECWRTNLTVAATCVSLKHERAADMLTVLGRFPEAVEQYLSARSQLALLAAPDAARCEQKLRNALNGERNEKDLA